MARRSWKSCRDKDRICRNKILKIGVRSLDDTERLNHFETLFFWARGMLFLETANAENFQARYNITHPATGDLLARMDEESAIPAGGSYATAAMALQQDKRVDMPFGALR